MSKSGRIRIAGPATTGFNVTVGTARTKIFALSIRLATDAFKKVRVAEEIAPAAPVNAICVGETALLKFIDGTVTIVVYTVTDLVQILMGGLIPG